MKDTWKNRLLGVLAAAAMAVCLAGCGKDTDEGNKTVTPAAGGATVTAEVTPTEAPTPTPTVSVIKTYETAGRDDIYRVPVEELTKDRSVNDIKTCGEYALLWLSQAYFPGASENDEVEPDVFVLIAPGLGSGTASVKPDFMVGDYAVLADGTVLLMDQENHGIHVYDNTMKEIRVIPTDGVPMRTMAGVDSDGRILTVFSDEGRIIARNAEGSTTATVTYDPKIFLTMYLGEQGGKWWFYGYSEGDAVYVCAPKNGGEAERILADAGSLGPEFKSDYMLAGNLQQICRLKSTYFFFEPGAVTKGFAVPKMYTNESVEFLQREYMCVAAEIPAEDKTVMREYHLYDTRTRTISNGLRIDEIAKLEHLQARSVIGDGFVLLDAMYEDGEKAILAWDTRSNEEPIAGICDLAKDSLQDSLNAVMKELAEKYAIKIEPDAIEDDGSAASVGALLQELDFINAFVCAARNNPQTVYAKDGATVHPENMENNGEGGHYTFQPHVFSEIYLKEHGEKRRQAMFNYVDALRAGEDRFECYDLDTGHWCFGRLGYFFSLVGPIYTSAGDYKDGWMEICYKIPKEEYLRKQEEFETMICDILNDALRDDYSDIEKALALYEYMTENYTYDYEMLAHCTEWMEKQSGYRCLMEKTGICNEIAKLYQFLLLQVGVDAEESGGEALKAGDDSHAWVFVRIDGQGYLIDPTWGLTENREPELAYFLFTDEMRKTRDGFNPDSFDVGSCPSFEARRKYSFEADDDRYKALWNGKYIAMDTAENCIYYWDYQHNMQRFDYSE